MKSPESQRAPGEEGYYTKFFTKEVLHTAHFRFFSCQMSSSFSIITKQKKPVYVTDSIEILFVARG